jgi:hypothetical protein
LAQELDQRRAAAKGDDAEYRSLVPSTDKNAHQHNVDRGREFSMSSSPRDTPAWTLASDKSSSIAKRPVATVKLLHWQNMDEEKDAEAAETKSEGKADEDISQSPASKIRPRLSATFRSVSRQKLDQLEVCMLLPPARADTHALAMQRKEQHNPPVGHYRPRFTVVERPPRPVSILRGERFVDLAAQASERGTRSVPFTCLFCLFVCLLVTFVPSFARSFVRSLARSLARSLGRSSVRPSVRLVQARPACLPRPDEHFRWPRGTNWSSASPMH